MLQAHTWQQIGTVSLWRYTENDRNFPGWHLSANAEGVAAILALLSAFEADGVAGSRTLTVAAPTASLLAVPNNRTSKWVAPSKFRLSFSAEPSQWDFPESLNPAELTFGAQWLPTLRQGVSGVSRGHGDYSVGCHGRNNFPLWFWWQSAAAA
jgi:hypothetical protein